MKKHGSRWCILLGLASAVLVLAACGGGGGGGDSRPAVPASYTGLTSQAVLTSANAPILVSGAWDGGGIADSAISVAPFATQTTALQQGGMVDLSQRLKELVLQTAVGNRAVARPAVVVTEPLPFDCGGSGSVTTDINDASGAFSGQFTFNSYCSQGTVLSGILNFSGQANPADGSISLLQLVFNNLLVSDGTFSGAVTEGSATFAFTANGLSETDTLNYVLRDDVLLKTYWVNNYVLLINYGTISDDVRITGRYYDSDLGFVDISTLRSLLVSLDPLPSDGILLFSGQGSQARLSFTPGQTSLLEIDGNNDGLFETSILNPL